MRRPLAVLLTLLLLFTGPTFAAARQDLGTPFATGCGTVPIFRGNPARTGEMPGPGPVTDPTVLWRFSIPPETGVRLGADVSGPAIVDGIAYASGFEGFVFAVDAATGEEHWRLETEPSRIAGQPAPTVVDGVVFVGGFEQLIAIDAITGQERWRVDLFVDSSPVVLDSMVYVVSSNGLYALDAKTGSQQWHFEVDTGTASSPAIADGTVYFGGGAGTIFAVDAATGVLRWQQEPEEFSPEPGNFVLSSTLRATPAVANGMVYGGSTGGSVFAMDAATGANVWTFVAGEDVWSSPAVAEGTVYAGSRDGNLYALDAATGQERWRFAAGDSIDSSPAVVDDVVYIAADDASSRRGALFAMDAATGAELWRVALDDPAGESSSVVVDGVVYIGSAVSGEVGTDGALSAIGDGSRVRSNPCAAADGTEFHPETLGAGIWLTWGRIVGSSYVGFTR
jgi:outer membrane protein assembly factor BamB